MPADAHYPAPPWHLQGHGLIVFTLKTKQDALLHLPREFTPVCFIPKKTPAGFYIAQYTTPLLDSETTPWHEWGEVCACAQYKNQKGYWIKEMVVDSNTARQGGIIEWGINKTKAAIHFEAGDICYASLQDDDLYIQLHWHKTGFRFPFKKRIWFLTQIKYIPHTYTVSLRGWFQLCKIQVTRDESMRYSSIQNGQYWGLQFQHAHITIEKPIAIE